MGPPLGAPTPFALAPSAAAFSPKQAAFSIQAPAGSPDEIPGAQIEGSGSKGEVVSLLPSSLPRRKPRDGMLLEDRDPTPLLPTNSNQTSVESSLSSTSALPGSLPRGHR